MVGTLARLLLLSVCAFAALSASAATALGLEEERIVLFMGLVVLLLLLPFLVRPVVAAPSGPLAVLCLLAAWIVLAGAAGPSFTPLDAKFLLPLLVLLAAPNLARHVEPDVLVELIWHLLSLYVTLTFARQLLADPTALVRGHDGITRLDPTGSVVMHSSLCLIHLVLAGGRLCRPLPQPWRAATLGLGLMALVMVLTTATRTALLTGALTASLLLATSPRPMAVLPRLLIVGLGLTLAFAAWTLLVDESFYRRLTGGQDDYSSGRWTSIRHWLALAAERPLGLGLGAVRAILVEDRPALDGATLLEWPHNEPIRFYVEAGPPGFLFVLLLVGLLVRRALRAATAAPDPARRALLLVIAADLAAEACLQNLFNAVYHATVLVLVLSLLVETTRRDAPSQSSPASAPGAASAGA
jgi:O-antigen ligase